MKKITSTEAKATLNALLAEVERTGTSVTITNHGRPVAILMTIPCRTPQSLSGKEARDTRTARGGGAPCRPSWDHKDPFDRVIVAKPPGAT
jgi:prevent-host-death family protein